MAIKLVTKSGNISLTTGGIPQSEVNSLLEAQKDKIKAEYAVQIDGLNAEINGLEEANTALENHNTQLSEQNNELSAENTALNAEVGTLNSTIDSLEAENAQLTNDVEFYKQAAPPEEAFIISGNCTYRFTNDGWDWFIEKYGNKITTKDISSGRYMFSSCITLKEIPIELNFNKSYATISSLFESCRSLETIPKINNCKPSDTNSLFYGCTRLRNLPDDIESWFDWSHIDKNTSSYSCNRSSMFNSCASLRSIPMGFLNHGVPNSAYSYSIYSSGFTSCYTLNEIVDLPIPHKNAIWTSNAFNSSFYFCHRLKNIIFTLLDGQPYVVQWKNQTIDLTSYVGYVQARGNITANNSGITANKEVTDDATYQALKNDPDWFTCNVAYSRYNHDSAVATINSLPDTSAYLAQKGGTNTIKFKGAAGSATDGGAINTLTEAEIAVATAKGWTISFV